MVSRRQDTGSRTKSLRRRVTAVLDEIRPLIQADGGDVELVDVDAEGVVSVRLQGGTGQALAGRFTSITCCNRGQRIECSLISTCVHATLSPHILIATPSDIQTSRLETSINSRQK